MFKYKFEVSVNRSCLDVSKHRDAPGFKKLKGFLTSLVLLSALYFCVLVNLMRLHVS